MTTRSAIEAAAKALEYYTSLAEPYNQKIGLEALTLLRAIPEQAGDARWLHAHVAFQNILDIYQTHLSECEADPIEGEDLAVLTDAIKEVNGLITDVSGVKL